MATNKKIEFELVFTTKAADGAVTKLNQQVVSVTSSLKESIGKVEVLKKVLESGSKQLPALDALKQLQAELAKASKSVNSLKDAQLKTSLSNYLGDVKSTPLPTKLASLIAPGKLGTVGDLTPRSLELLQKAYDASILKGKADLPTKVIKELESAIKANTLVLSRKETEVKVDIPKLLSNFVKAQQATNRSEITNKLSSYLQQQKAQQVSVQPINSAYFGKNMTEVLSNLLRQQQAANTQQQNQTNSQTSQRDVLASIRALHDKILAPYRDIIKNALPIKPYQTPSGRLLEEKETTFSKLSLSGKFLNTRQAAAEVHVNVLDREAALFKKNKPLTYVQEQLTLIESLKKKLYSLPVTGVLGNLWGETAIEIKHAEDALKKYIETEKKLNLQNNLLTVRKDLGNQFLQKAAIQSTYAVKDVPIAQKIQREQEQALAKVTARFNSKMQQIVDGLTPNSTTKERAAAVRGMRELGVKAERQLTNVKLETESKLLVASLKEELAVLKAQLVKKDELKTRTQEINQLMQKLASSTLPSSSVRDYIRQLQEARKTLLEIDSTNRRIQATSNSNARQLNYGKSSLSDVDARRQLQIVQGKYGVDSLQAINLSEQQQLQALRERAARKVSKADSLLTSTSTQSDRNKYKQVIDSVTSAYDRQAEAIVRNSAALRANNAVIQAHLKAHTNFLVKIAEFVVGYRLINQALDATVNFVQNIPESGIRLENVNAIFTAMFVKTAEVTKQFNFLDEVADRTGGRLKTLRTELADYAASAKAAGESTANINKGFEDLTEVATVLHLPEEKVHGALVAISQMYAKNQVMAEELKRQLGNVLPGAVAVFARSQNMTSRELLDAMKIGAVKPKDTIPQFLSYYKSVFAPKDAFDKASAGLYANLGRFENEYTRTSEALYFKSSASILKFVQAGTEGLKELRSNLDSVLTILKDIAIVGGVAAGASIFAVGKNKLARNALDIANTSRNFSRGQRQLNAQNPADLLPFLAVSRIPSNAFSVITKGISNIHPAVKLATILVGGLEAAIYKLKDTKVDIGDNIKLSGLDILQIKFESLATDLEVWSKKSWIAKIGIEETSSTGKTLQNVADKLETLAAEGVTIPVTVKEAAYKLPVALPFLIADAASKLPIDKILESTLTAEEKVAEKRKRQQAKELADYKKFKEDLHAEAQKSLIEEPVSLIENMFDSKGFTRAIDIIGRAVTTEISLISELANKEIQKLELRVANLDRKAKLGLLSPGDVLSQKLDAIRQERTIRNEQTDKTLQLNLQPIKLNQEFAQTNEKVEAFDKRLALLRDKQEMLLSLESGTLNLDVRDPKTKEVKQKTIEGLGYVAQTDKDKNLLISSAKLQEEITKVVNAREEVLKILASKDNEGLNTGIKATFVNKPTYTTDFEIRDVGKQIDEVSAARQKEIEARQAVSIALEQEAIQISNGELTDKQKKNVKATAPVLEKYRDIIDTETDKYKLPVGLIEGIITQESRGITTALSKKGAKGLMQLMPATGKRYGVTDRDDPVQSIQGGAAYLNFLYNENKATKGDITKTSMAYNSGEGKFDKVVAGKAKFMPETINYGNEVPKLISFFNQLSPRIDGLLEGVKAANSLDKTDRTAGVAAAGRGFAAREAMYGAELSNLQTNNQLDIKIQNLIDEFSFSKLETRETFKQQITSPFNRLARPGDVGNLTQDFNSQYAIVLRQLDSELKTKDPNNRIFTDKEVEDFKQALNEILKLQTEVFKREQERAIFQSKQNILATQRSNKESTFDYQSGSAYNQILTSKPLIAKQLNFAVNNRDKEFERIRQDTGLANLESNKYSILDGINNSGLPSDEKVSKIRAFYKELEVAQAKTSEAMTNYDSQIVDLQEQSKELANYWKTNIREALSSPLKQMLLDWDKAEEAAKSFGLTVLDNVANNITDKLSKGISDMLVKAGEELIKNKTTNMIFSGIMSLFGGAGTAGAYTGGYIDSYAVGGDTSKKPVVIASTAKVKGSGTGTSDSVKAVVRKGSYILNAETAKRVNLSNGEIVIDPETTKAIGKENLDKLNFEGNYYSGGMVGNKSKPINKEGYQKEQPITQYITYNFDVHVKGGDNPKDTGEQIAKAFIEKVSKATAMQVATTVVKTHEKQMHKRH